VLNEFYSHGLWPRLDYISYALPDGIGLVVWIISLSMLFYQMLMVCKEASAKSIATHNPKFRPPYDPIFYVKDEVVGIISEVLRSSKYLRKMSSFWKNNTTTQKLARLYERIVSILKEKRSWEYILLSAGSVALLLQLISATAVLLWSRIIISTQMSFGQIVAVGIWIPVFLEYGYLEISKSSAAQLFWLEANYFY